MHDRFFLVWLTCTLILVAAAWAAIVIVFIRCFRFDVDKQQSTSNSLTETHTYVERTRLSVLSRPIIEKLSSTTYFETHIIETIERLSNIALCFAIGWMRRVLGLQSPSHQGRTIHATPSKGKVQIVQRKRIDDKAESELMAERIATNRRTIVTAQFRCDEVGQNKAPNARLVARCQGILDLEGLLEFADHFKSFPQLHR